eukprot:9080075-Alexandrium_andersonii.AAC.1
MGRTPTCSRLLQPPRLLPPLTQTLPGPGLRRRPARRRGPLRRRSERTPGPMTAALLGTGRRSAAPRPA